MTKLKNISLAIIVIFYLTAGFNHFYNPGSYLKIIPPYFPHPTTLNLLAGFFEIAFAITLIFKNTRNYAAWGIILMLIAFTPVHVQMVRDAPLMLGTLKVSPLVAWIRLVILQPLLILWAWWYVKD